MKDMSPSESLSPDTVAGDLVIRDRSVHCDLHELENNVALVISVDKRVSTYVLFTLLIGTIICKVRVFCHCLPS